MRKSLAVAVIVVIAGLAPASAIIGFCARMPCCNHRPAAPVASSAGTSGCCTTIACDESPSAKLTTSTAGAGARIASVTTAQVIFVASSPRPLPAKFADTSPPPGDRLAMLSTLLI